jgi:hypothetical protein
MARTRTTARKSTGGWVPHHQLAPHEPRPEPTVEESLRVELAEVTAESNVVQQRLEQVTHERDQETLVVQRLTIAHRNCECMLVHMLN